MTKENVDVQGLLSNFMEKFQQGTKGQNYSLLQSLGWQIASSQDEFSLSNVCNLAAKLLFSFAVLTGGKVHASSDSVKCDGFDFYDTMKAEAKEMGFVEFYAERDLLHSKHIFLAEDAIITINIDNSYHGVKYASLDFEKAARIRKVLTEGQKAYV